MDIENKGGPDPGCSRNEVASPAPCSDPGPEHRAPSSAPSQPSTEPKHPHSEGGFQKLHLMMTTTARLLLVSVASPDARRFTHRISRNSLQGDILAVPTAPANKASPARTHQLPRPQRWFKANQAVHSPVRRRSGTTFITVRGQTWPGCSRGWSVVPYTKRLQAL